MATLDSSWNLEHRLMEAKCSSKLKEAIEDYIQRHQSMCTGRRMSVLNLRYRVALHYIEDNIHNEDKLLKELEDEKTKSRRLQQP